MDEEDKTAAPVDGYMGDDELETSMADLDLRFLDEESDEDGDSEE
jgi:hypothetical protein